VFPFLWIASAAPVEPALSPALALVLAALLVLVNGFFVAAEFALVKVRSTQLDALAGAGDRRAKLARYLVRHLDAYLSGCQLGITLASLALGWIGEPAFLWLAEPLVSWLPGASPQLVHSVSITLAFATITILHIIVGELAPKSLAIRKAEAMALWVAYPLHAFQKMSYPAIWLLNHGSNALLKMFGSAPALEHDLAHSEEELRMLLSQSEMGRQGPLKRELLDNVFELSARMTRQVMVPRADVVFLNTELSLEDNLRAARQSGHTRFPLCEGDLDKVVGLIHIKDLFRAEKLPGSLREIAREITFVPETLTLDRLLKRLRGERVHLAAVIDEYGGVSGVVSLENVIEEIVGPIQDEFDAEKPEIVDKGESVYQVSGGMLVADLEDELRLEISDRNEDTIGGVVLSELGRRPRVGDQVEVGPLRIEILEVERNRVKSLRIAVHPGAREEPAD